MLTNSSLSSSDTGHDNSTITDDAVNAVYKGVDSAGAALHSGIEKVSEPAIKTIERLSTAAHDTVNKIASSATHTAERFSDKTKRVTEAPSQALESSKSWVQDKPLEAVAAALAIGFILGRMTGR